MPIVASITKHAAHARPRPDAIAGELRRRAARRVHAAPRARRSSTCRSTRGDATDGDVADPADADELAGAAPDRRRGRDGRRARRRGATARCSWSAATSTGPAPRTPLRAFAEAARAARSFANGLGRGAAAGRPRARVLAGAGGGVRGRRPRLVAGHAARLPPRLRARSATPGRAPGRLARGRRRARRPRGARGRRPRARRSPRSPTATRGAVDAASDDGVDRRRCATRRRARARAEERRASTPTRRRSDPARIYGELRRRLDRDAIVIGDGGDFVSYAGKYIDTYTPGCFLGPGPVRLPRHGARVRARGRARASRTARSSCCSATARSGSRSATSTRSCASASTSSAIVGNNGIWGLEKHPMQLIFGYDVVAELRPGTRYDQVAEALGGHGELVQRARRDRPRARPGVRARRARRS